MCRVTIVNAVFEGGGVRGVALAGAAAAALDHGYTFDHTVGTSAGSLVASLLAAGYDAEELSSIVCAVDWPGLLDPFPSMGIPLVGRHVALVLHKGLYRGEELERIWGELLCAKGVKTFADLRPGSLSVVATDLSHGRGVSLPGALTDYGVDPVTFPVARAVRMSSSVPFLFRPVALRDHTRGEDVLMVDGAMAANYPVGLARRDRPVIGFRLHAEADQHPHERVRGPASLARSVVIAGIRARYSLPRAREVGAHVITVPVSADLDFDISPDDARAVFDRGRHVAARQLEHLDLEAEAVA